MRENRTSGSEGGAADQSAVPTPIKFPQFMTGCSISLFHRAVERPCASNYRAARKPTGRVNRVCGNFFWQVAGFARIQPVNPSEFLRIRDMMHFL